MRLFKLLTKADLNQKRISQLIPGFAKFAYLVSHSRRNAHHRGLHDPAKLVEDNVFSDCVKAIFAVEAIIMFIYHLR